MKKIILRKINFQNLISNTKKITIDFESEYHFIKKWDFFSSNFENKESKKEFGVAKILGFIGKNSSYKTSTLNGIFEILSIFSNCSNVKILKIMELEDKFNSDKSSFNEFHSNALKWNKENQENEIFFNKYLDYLINNLKQKEAKKLEKEYILKKFDELASNKNNPFNIEIEYSYKDKLNEKNTFSLNILKINSDLNYVFKHNDESIEIADFKNNPFNDFNFFFKLEYKKRIDDIIKEIFTKLFKNNEEKMTNFLKLLDPSIVSFTILKYDSDKLPESFNIRRQYNSDPITTETSARNLSSGTKLFIKYILAIFKNDFIIFDEIETDLHYKYIEMIFDFVKSQDKQIIFSTHNPMIVNDLISRNQLYIFDLNDENILKIQKASEINEPDLHIKDLISSPKDTDIDDLFIGLND